MDDFVNLFWLATRSNVSLAGYIAGAVSARACGIPKVHLSMVLLLAATDGITADDGNILTSLTSMSITFLPDWEIAVWSLTTIPATIYVHGTHLILIYRALVNFWDKWRSKKGLALSAASNTLQSDTAHRGSSMGGTIDVAEVSPGLLHTGDDTQLAINSSSLGTAQSFRERAPDSQRRQSMVRPELSELNYVPHARILVLRPEHQEVEVNGNSSEIKLNWIGDESDAQALEDVQAVAVGRLSNDDIQVGGQLEGSQSPVQITVENGAAHEHFQDSDEKFRCKV